MICLIPVFLRNPAMLRLNSAKKLKIEVANCKDSSSDAKNHACLLVKTAEVSTDFFQLITRVFVTPTP